jgi:hypothetical protein
MGYSSGDRALMLELLVYWVMVAGEASDRLAFYLSGGSRLVVRPSLWDLGLVPGRFPRHECLG